VLRNTEIIPRDSEPIADFFFHPHIAILNKVTGFGYENVFDVFTSVAGPRPDFKKIHRSFRPFSLPTVSADLIYPPAKLHVGHPARAAAVVTRVPGGGLRN
jgi:hypothetical protein